MPDLDPFNARRLPARIHIEQVAKLLGFHEDSVDYLVEIRMLNILGGYSRGTQRMFASAYILELCNNLEWLDKATKKVRQFHARKNAVNKAKRHNRSPNGTAPEQGGRPHQA